MASPINLKDSPLNTTNRFYRYKDSKLDSTNSLDFKDSTSKLLKENIKSNLIANNLSTTLNKIFNILYQATDNVVFKSYNARFRVQIKGRYV